ncbi:DnaJ-domain-containing protein [Rhizopogon vinicolor AM-OR11-026]|uniref:DnaJ-domain-containing protein n=1 Tax=Rhizopogon vinicolor AM-OR11-026 TaxID=1314800 RepID=A0A1B7NC74_9AGAM|nr:DnaJ-domain-containing protein [Rhizopogon vinicolor AM-OR11-026]
MPAAIRNPVYYNVLGLTVDASDEEIRAAYKKLALQWHPDRHMTNKEHAAQMFVEVNTAYHSLMDGIESMHSFCGDSASPSHTPTETGTARSHSADPKPQATQPPRRPTSSGSRKNEQEAPNSFSSASSVPGSNAAKPSQPFSSDNKTSHHSSRDHHSSPKTYSTQPSSAGSNGHSRSNRTRTSKSYDNLRDPPRASSPSHASPSSAGRFHSSRSNAPSHSKSHDNLRNPPCNSHESGQVPSPTADGPKSETSNRSKNNHTAQEAAPTFNSPKGGLRSPRDAKSWRSRTDKYSQPVIPRMTSKLQKRSPLGLGEELLHKISKASSKVKKEGGSTLADNAPTYGSPLRPLGAPRGVSKDWLFPLPLTLDEMFHGAAYRFLVTRELLSRKTEQVEISIDVPPGVRSGTRIVCPRTGHQRKDGSLQDVIFLVEAVPHGRFSRGKDDLFIDICVPWVETLAEQGGDICIDGMDGEEIIFTLPYPIYDKSTEGEVLVKGAGMPIRQGRKTVGRGDLIVRWQVVFSSPSKWKTFKKVLRIKV